MENLPMKTEIRKMETDIGKRLKEYRQQHHVKMSVVAAATGIKANTLYKWEKGTRPQNVYLFNKLDEYLNGDETDSALADELVESPVRYLSLADITVKPFICIKHGLDAGSMYHGKNGKPYLVVKHLHAPGFNAEGILDVVDDAMLPVFKRGDAIAVSRIIHPGDAGEGECFYIIDKEENSIIRRLKARVAEHAVILEAANADKETYPDIIRTYDQLLAMVKIMFRIERQ